MNQDLPTLTCASDPQTRVLQRSGSLAPACAHRSAQLAPGGLGGGAPRCAKMTWRNDPGQYSHGLYQGGHEPLGRRARWMQAWGERAGPERPPEVRCRPPRWEGLVERSHGESTRSGSQPTGKSPPASRPCTMGQRTNPEGFSPLEGLPCLIVVEDG
jgi:hypothetical protein